MKQFILGAALGILGTAIYCNRHRIRVNIKHIIAQMDAEEDTSHHYFCDK